jgi:hypothetical protein
MGLAIRNPQSGSTSGDSRPAQEGVGSGVVGAQEAGGGRLKRGSGCGSSLSGVDAVDKPPDDHGVKQF